MKQANKRDIIISVVLIFLGIIAIVAAQNYPKQSRVIPVIYSSLLIMLSLFLLVKSFKLDPKKKNLDLNEPYKKFFVVATAILIYILAIRFLGFYSSTFVFMVVFMILLKAARLKTVLLISITTIGLIYLFFDMMLHIPIPGGIIF
jgi:hypothetical protein